MSVKLLLPFNGDGAFIHPMAFIFAMEETKRDLLSAAALSSTAVVPLVTVVSLITAVSFVAMLSLSLLPLLL